MDDLCPIAWQAAHQPQKTAIVTDEKCWSFQECHLFISAVCVHLKDRGIESSSRVAFIALKDIPTIFLLFALFRLGAVACPLSFRQPPSTLPLLLKTLNASHYLNPPSVSSLKHPCSLSRFEKINPHRLALCLFTSASSGKPKIVCHSLSAFFYNAWGAFDSLPFTTTSSWLLSLPLFHVGGLSILFRCFLQAAPLVMSSLSLLEALRKYQISHVSLVPTQLFRLLKEKDLRKNSSLKCVLVGGARLSPLFRRKAQQLPIFTTYGMTETASMITVSKSTKEDHVGKPVASCRLFISLKKEIFVQGKTLFLGYWNENKQEIESPLSAKGFFTRDLGEWTAAGNLRILGRADRLFISGGENIFPEEIESALCTLPGILTATVVPVEDEEFGQRPVAFVLDETGNYCLPYLREALATLLPSFKLPIALFPYPQHCGLKISHRQLEIYAKNKCKKC